MPHNQTPLPRDLRLIQHFRSAAPALTDAELAAGRAELMSTLLAEPPSGARRGWRPALLSRRAPLPHRAPLSRRAPLPLGLALGGALAAIVAVATLMPSAAPQATTGPAVKLSLAAKILRGAANHYAHMANAGGTAEPAPKQWIYFTFAMAGGGGEASSVGDWTTFDGSGAASMADGKLLVQRVPWEVVPPDASALHAYDVAPSPMTAYDALASLAQDDPATLLAAAYADASRYPPQWVSPSERPFITMPAAAALEYEWLQGLLQGTYLAPAGAEAAVFRAMSTLPGLRVVQGLTSATGAPAVGITSDGGITDLMFSPADHSYIGVRSIDSPPAPSTASTPTTPGADPPAVYTLTSVKLVSGPGVR